MQYGQRDQLAREIEDLHQSDSLRSFNINLNKLDHINLIYLTNHTSFPFDEVRESINHLKSHSFSIEGIYWLTWREIHHTLSKISHYKTNQNEKLLSDLKRVLEKKGLNSFNGFQHQMKKVTYLNQTFKSSLIEYTWKSIKKTERVLWSYGGEQHG